MKKYLLIGGWRGTVQKDQLDKKDLIEVKENSRDFIIDTESGTFFNSDTNSWEEIATIE